MNLAGLRALVVGGAGNIGSHVVDALVRENAQVTVYDSLARGHLHNLQDARELADIPIVDGDVGDRTKLQTACEGMDVVFHLAAAWLLQATQSPRVALDVNVVGTYNVLEAAAAAKVKKVVFSSAGAVYGDPRYVPIDENHPLDANTAYGASKIAGEKFCEAFYQMYGLNYIALRYWNVYGPRADVVGSVASVLPRWLDRLERGEAIEIYDDGLQTMDFIYVTEVARANLLACQSTATHEVVNVGSGIETTANELADLLLRMTGSQEAPIRRPEIRTHVRRRCADTRKAEHLLQFRSQVALQDGLSALLEWRRVQSLSR